MDLLYNLWDRLSRLLYDRLLETSGDSDYSYFNNVFVQAHPSNGMMWMLGILLVCSIAFAAYFYFVHARNVNNVTKGNYLFICLFGILVMTAVAFIIMKLVVELPEPIQSSNMWRSVVANAVYYLVLFELFSLWFRHYSNAKNYDLIGVWRK